MKIVPISIKEYKKMYEDMKSNTRFENPHIDPIMKEITVIGSSGPGTEFENEYERLMYEHFNPPLPLYIDWYDFEGITRYIPSTKKCIT